MRRRTKAGRRAAFRAYLARTMGPVGDAPPTRRLADRCYGGRCFGGGWLACWCGLCGEEPCYGCRDCRDRDEVDDGEPGDVDDEGDDGDGL